MIEQTNYTHNYSFNRDLLSLQQTGIIDKITFDAISRDLEC